MPQDTDTGRDGRDFGIEANRAAAGRFRLLARDDAESTAQKTVLRDRAGRTYWVKNGRNTPTMSVAALRKYHALLIEDGDGRLYALRCADVLGHPEAKESKSSGHGPQNPHLQLAMRHVRTLGTEIDAATFDGTH